MRGQAVNLEALRPDRGGGGSYCSMVLMGESRGGGIERTRSLSTMSLNVRQSESSWLKTMTEMQKVWHSSDHKNQLKRKASTDLLNALIDVGVIIMYRGVYFLILAPIN